MNKVRVFLVDDDLDLLHSTSDWISMNGFEVSAFENAIDAIRQLDNVVPDILVSDIRMPGVDGLNLLATVKKTHPSLPVILLTGHGDIRLAVNAMRVGAEDFLEKPYDADHLIAVFERARQRRAMQTEIGRLQKIVRSTSSGQEQVLGDHPSMLSLREHIDMTAALDIDVLITGETGTGKELVARTLHEKSARAARPFVPIHCASIPDASFEIELFGYAKGAFIGADKDKAGKFEYAAGGTILLDDVDTLVPSMQTKLLRILEERSIERLGENRSRPIDVRILATSKMDLQQKVQLGVFRDDLYYRLAKVNLTIPPLRQRGNDILLLYAHFLRLASRQYGAEPVKLQPDLSFALLGEEWPGNVRELKSRAEANALGLDWAFPTSANFLASPKLTFGLNDELRRIEKELIEKALISSDHNIAEAARILQIPRRTLSEKIARLGI